MVKVTLLGIAQDGGRPQAGCNKPCCDSIQRDHWSYPVSLGIVGDGGKGHLIEASRHLTDQLEIWGHNQISDVWLTHAHLGHVDGLGLFGKETMGKIGLNLHLSASMLNLVHNNPFWKSLLDQKVFKPKQFSNGEVIDTESRFAIQAIQIPHRDELSDMHAFLVKGEKKNLLFLPDHDTWEETLKFHEVDTIRAFLAKYSVDIALIDGTFWSSNELSGRFQHEVPHPPVRLTVEMLGERREEDPEILFIHLNHTNPLYLAGEERQFVIDLGWQIGEQGMIFDI